MRSVPTCVCVCVRACVRARVCARTRIFSNKHNRTGQSYLDIYTHIHICVVVFCPDSVQEHVDHTWKKKGHGSVYLRAHVRLCVCVLMCECVYVRARMGVYIPSHTVT